MGTSGCELVRAGTNGYERVRMGMAQAMLVHCSAFRTWNLVNSSTKAWTTRPCQVAFRSWYWEKVSTIVWTRRLCQAASGLFQDLNISWIHSRFCCCWIFDTICLPFFRIWQKRNKTCYSRGGNESFPCVHEGRWWSTATTSSHTRHYFDYML